MSDRPISLHDFKNWLAGQKGMSEFFSLNIDSEDPNEKYIGCIAKTKVSEQKLMEKIETEDNPEILVREFVEEGGSVLGVEGKKVLIEVESGIFYIPKFCVKIRKN